MQYFIKCFQKAVKKKHKLPEIYFYKVYFKCESLILNTVHIWSPVWFKDSQELTKSQLHPKMVTATDNYEFTETDYLIK